MFVGVMEVVCVCKGDRAGYSTDFDLLVGK